MDRVRLGRSDLEVSRVGQGLWQAAGRSWGDDFDERRVVEAARRSFELGVNFFDTAEIYGDGLSERILGRAIAELDRESVVVATKVHGEHLRYDELLRSFELSASRLGVKYVDLYQVHWPDPWEQVPLRETMRAMEKLYVEGKIRAIGVSNFAVRDLEEASSALSRAEIASNQVRYNVLQREVEEEVKPYCRENGITMIAWSPLAQGALTGKYPPGRRPRDRIRSDNKLFKEENLRAIASVVEVLRAIAERRGRTVAQVALNWLLKDDYVIPIPGAKDPGQAEENAGSCCWRLTDDEVRGIDEAYRRIRIDYL